MVVRVFDQHGSLLLFEGVGKLSEIENQIREKLSIPPEKRIHLSASKDEKGDCFLLKLDVLSQEEFDLCVEALRHNAIPFMSSSHPRGTPSVWPWRLFASTTSISSSSLQI